MNNEGKSSINDIQKELYKKIPTPAALINLDTVDANITKMVEINKKYNIAHWPHIKPHKCPFLAKRQLELGAEGITCAKLAEAEVMVDFGIDNILVAFPLIGEDKLIRYAKLTQKANMLTIVNSYHGAKTLSKTGLSISKRLPVLIEIDGGLNRGGVKPGEDTLAFAKSIKELEGIEISGLLYYGGTIYDKSTKEDIINAVEEERNVLLKNAEMLEVAGFKMEILSAGNSFSSKYPKYLQGVTNTRAGNYIFNDCTQLTIGLVEEEDCALRILATIVSMPDEYHAIIDAGSKSLTNDTNRYREGRGIIVGHPEIRIPKLNEEHGFIESDTHLPFKIGEKIEIIPNHACVILNINELVYGYRNDGTIKKLEITARAKNY